MRLKAALVIGGDKWITLTQKKTDIRIKVISMRHKLHGRLAHRLQKLNSNLLNSMLWYGTSRLQYYSNSINTVSLLNAAHTISVHRLKVFSLSFAAFVCETIVDRNVHSGIECCTWVSGVLLCRFRSPINAVQYTLQLRSGNASRWTFHCLTIVRLDLTVWRVRLCKQGSRHRARLHQVHVWVRV